MAAAGRAGASPFQRRAPSGCPRTCASCFSLGLGSQKTDFILSESGHRGPCCHIKRAGQIRSHSSTCCGKCIPAAPVRRRGTEVRRERALARPRYAGFLRNTRRPGAFDDAPPRSLQERDSSATDSSRPDAIDPGHRALLAVEVTSFLSEKGFERGMQRVHPADRDALKNARRGNSVRARRRRRPSPACRSRSSSPPTSSRRRPRTLARSGTSPE